MDIYVPYKARKTYAQRTANGDERIWEIYCSKGCQNVFCQCVSNNRVYTHMRVYVCI